MARYFSKNVFVHTHIEKTGGSTFVAALRSMFGEEHVYDIRKEMPRLADLTPKERMKIWLFTGHFWFDTQERPLARKKRYFLNIRDPIDRFISHYNYVAYSKSHPGHSKYGVLDIEDAYRYLSKHMPTSVTNTICTIFTKKKDSIPFSGIFGRKKDKVSFDEVRAVMEQNYALVIPMVRVDDAVRRIGAVFGLEVGSVRRVNVGVKKQTTLPERIRQELKERNAEDYKLIAHFESVFDEHLRDLRARLTS